MADVPQVPRLGAANVLGLVMNKAVPQVSKVSVAIVKLVLGARSYRSRREDRSSREVAVIRKWYRQCRHLARSLTSSDLVPDLVAGAAVLRIISNCTDGLFV